jgi:hypothetical protein
MDVILRHGPTIGNVAEAFGKRECFGGKVEFEYVVAVGKRNRQRGRVGIIGAEDGVEAVAGEVSGKRGEWAERRRNRRWSGFGGVRAKFPEEEITG